jgi:hypothetical protein
MRYVIGESNFSFVQIESSAMWDGYNRYWNEIHKVWYDCNIEEATIINSHDEARKVLNEIQSRTSEINFDNVSVIGQILDERRNFDKFDFAQKLKIYRLVPTLVED